MSVNRLGRLESPPQRPFFPPEYYTIDEWRFEVV